MNKPSIAAMKHAIANSVVQYLKDHTGEALVIAQDIAAIELLALAAHLHLASGRSEENFIERAFACFIEVQHECGSAPRAMQ
jgi:hypothetical protein